MIARFLEENLDSFSSLRRIQSRLVRSDSPGFEVEVRPIGAFLTEYRGRRNGQEAYFASVDQDGGDTELRFTDSLDRRWRVRGSLREEGPLRIHRSDSGEEFDFDRHCVRSWEAAPSPGFPDTWAAIVEQLNIGWEAAGRPLRLAGSPDPNVPFRWRVRIERPLVATRSERDEIEADLAVAEARFDAQARAEHARLGGWPPPRPWQLAIYFERDAEADARARTQPALAALRDLGVIRVRRDGPLLRVTLHPTRALTDAEALAGLRDLHAAGFGDRPARAWAEDRPGSVTEFHATADDT
jgi:hypothetical protein